MKNGVFGDIILIECRIILHKEALITVKKLKKRAIIITAAVMVFAICACYFTLPFCVFSKGESTAEFNKNDGVIRAEESLVILQITDLHVNGALDMPMIFSCIKALVRKTKPDLIVITGDLFSNGCSERDVATFLRFMGDLGLPWAAVLGNHDDETPYSLEELSLMLESAENSLFRRGDLTGLYGNYFYDVEFADGGEYRLIFMDSRSDGFTEESVAFYESAVRSSLADDGSVVDSLLFFHIPLPETYDAIAEYEDGKASGTGKIREEICSQENQVGFFEKVVELGSTKAMIYGHDHFNDAKTSYLGVEFNYGTKTGPSSSNLLWLMGGTVYTLTSDGEYTVTDVLVP